MKQPPYRTTRQWKQCACVKCRVGFCLCLFILFSCEDSVSSLELPVVMKVPGSGYLEENKTASFECVVAPPADLQPGEFPLSWSRVGGLPVSASINNSTEGTGGVVSYHSTLTFTPGALDNQIAITCTARIGSASGSASYTPRVILVPHDPIIVAPNSSDASGKLTWTCHSHGASQSPPNVYWRDGNGSALRSGVSTTTSVEQKPHENIVYSIALTITRQAKDFLAAASLVCVVVHGLGEYSSRRSAAQVLELPRVSKKGSDVLYVTEGARLTVSCLLDIGHPPATNIAWTKGGQPVALTAPGRYANVSTTSPDLVILSVNKHDMGDYLCSATSLLGSARFTSPTTVIVRYSPHMAQLTNASTLEATPGGSVILPCPVSSFPSPTSILWSRVMDGQTQVLNISSSARYSGGSATDQQYDLGISPLQASDAGVYICEAFNEVGRGTGPAITLVVTSPSALVMRASADKVTAVVFGVISLVLLIVIVVTIMVACYICKCSKGHERARVGPLTTAAVKPSGRIFLPALNPESGHAPNSDEDAVMLTTPVPFLPPARHGDDHADSCHHGPLPETSETPVFRLPHLDPETRSYDTPFRMFLPALNPEAGHAPKSDEDAVMLTTPVTFLPPARRGDDHADSGHHGPLPETSETPVFRLPHLDPETRSYDTPFSHGPLPETSETPVFRLPHLDPETRSYDTPFRMFLPALNPESSHAPKSDEDAVMLTTPVTFLPPARPGDDHADSGHHGPLPETSETPVFRLPHLDPETRSYDTPFRWSAHLQNNPQTSNGNVFKVSGGSVSSSVDQTSVLREKLAMMK